MTPVQPRKARRGRSSFLNWAYGLLEIPWIYRLSQVLLAPGKPWMIRPIFEGAFDRTAGRILDVGCGPKLVTPEPLGLLVGVDINGAYLREYTGGYLDQDPKTVRRPPAGRKRLGFLAPADRLPFPKGTFDEARAIGFLHHLTDEQVSGALKEMHRCLRSGGKLVVLEDVWPLASWRRPIAWAIRRLDRGEHMRTQEELLSLFRRSCPGDRRWSRHTYTWVGSEMLQMTLVKK